MALIASFVVGRREGLTFVMYSSLLSNFSSFTLKFFLACKLACFTHNYQRPCRARVFGWGVRFHFSHLSHSGAQNVFSPRGRHQTLRLLFRAAHPLVHESWSKIGIEIRQILFILRKKICHQFPTKFCQFWLTKLQHAVVLPRSRTNFCQAWNLTDLSIHAPWLKENVNQENFIYPFSQSILIRSPPKLFLSCAAINGEDGRFVPWNAA